MWLRAGQRNAGAAIFPIPGGGLGGFGSGRLGPGRADLEMDVAAMRFTAVLRAGFRRRVVGVHDVRGGADRRRRPCLTRAGDAVLKLGGDERVEVEEESVGERVGERSLSSRYSSVREPVGQSGRRGLLGLARFGTLLMAQSLSTVRWNGTPVKVPTTPTKSQARPCR